MALLTAAMVVSGAALAGAAGTVTNCLAYGPGPGTLATALVGGGTATFVCSGTIIVPEIVITTDTVIDATGQTVELRGSNASRVLSVSGARLDLAHLAITGGTASHGGGLRAERATLTLTDSTVSGNSASSGGGLFASESTITMTSSTLGGNSAAERGGGLWAANATVTLVNTTVSDNWAGVQGGCLYAEDHSTVTLRDSAVSGNATLGFGGGLSLNYSSAIVLITSTVSGNTASWGGGLDIGYGSTATLTHSTVTQNQADWGGGLYASSSTVALTSSTVSGNTAAAVGGGLFVYWRSTATLTRSTVSANSTETSGGGLAASGGSTLTLINSTVSGNSAVELGGGLWASDATVALAYSTVSDNAAAQGGGLHASVVSSHAKVSLKNSIVATQLAGEDCAAETGASITSAGYSLDSDGTCGLAVLGDQPGIDPLLGPLQDNGGPTWTHELLPGSPAIDAIPVLANGCGEPWQTDQRGVLRPRGASCDIGAYEAGGLVPFITVNQPSFAPGQTLTAAAGLLNPGLPGAADFYIGVLEPDGHTIAFFTGTWDLVIGDIAEMATFRPVAAGVELDEPFSVTLPRFFSQQWTGGEPRGGYLFFLLAVQAGALADGTLTPEEALALAMAPFSFP